MKKLYVTIIAVFAFLSTGLTILQPPKVPPQEYFDCAGVEDVWHIADVLESTGKRLFLEVKSELGKWMALKIVNWGKALKVRVDEFDLKNSCKEA